MPTAVADLLALAGVLGDSWPATYFTQYASAPNPCGCPPARHLGNFATAWDEYPGLMSADGREERVSITSRRAAQALAWRRGATSRPRRVP